MTPDATRSPTKDSTRLAAVRRSLAATAMVGVITYVIVDVILQFLPPHYSVIRDAESNLAVGSYGWIMNLNFLGRAATTACVVLSILRVGHPERRRTYGLWLLAAGGAASAVLAFFPTDVAPAGVRGEGRLEITYTSVGVVHLTVATLGFLAALTAVIVLTTWLSTAGVFPGRAGPAPGRAGIRRALIGCVVLAAVGFLALGLSFTVTPEILGLAERICLAGILGWTFVVSAGIRRLPESVGSNHD